MRQNKHERRKRDKARHHDMRDKNADTRKAKPYKRKRAGGKIDFMDFEEDDDESMAE